MYLRKAALILLASAILTGCTSSDDDGDLVINPEDETNNGLPADSDNEAGTSMQAPGSNPSDTPQALTRFDGNYLNSCQQDPDDEDNWQIRELSIQADTFSSILTEFSDSECTQPTLELESTLSATYPGGTASTSLGEADFINLEVETASSDGTSVNLDASFFELILLDGNSLYFGLSTDELDGDTVETRPNELDLEVEFILQ